MQITEDDGDDDEEGSEADTEDPPFETDDDEIVTVDCPYCRQPIWEEAIACEHCGSYLSKEDKPWSRPWWLLVGCLVGLYAVYLWIRYSH